MASRSKKPNTRKDSPAATIEQGEEVGKNASEAFEKMEPQRAMWATLEDLGLGRFVGKTGNRIRSRVSEGTLASQIWEAASREMAQPPSGSFRSLAGKEQRGKTELYNLAFHNYVIPNDDAQYRHPVKLRLWNLYRKIYGGMIMMYGMESNKDYQGPSSYLLRPHHYAPEVGRLSFNECDRHYVSTFYTPKQLEGLKGKKGVKSQAINKIIKDASGAATKYASATNRSNISGERHPGASDGSTIELITEYVVGKGEKWITVAPEHDNVIVKIVENKQPGGRVPLVNMPALPLLDTIMGLGEAEMNESIQRALDTWVNLGLDAGKYGIFPPTIVDIKNVVPSSIRWKPQAIWKEKKQNSIREHQISRSNVNTFNTYFQHLKGAMLSRNATTDTSISVGDDPQQGKTPQALKMRQATEFARDNWSREMMEESVSELYEGMMNLWASRQEAPFNFHMFDEEIEKITVEDGKKKKLELYGSDVRGDTEDKAVKVTVKGDALEGSCRYFIDGGSSLRKDEKDEHERLGDVIMSYLEMKPVLDPELAANHQKMEVGEAFKRWLITSGVKDHEKILRSLSADEISQQEQAIAQEEQMVQQAQQQQAQPQAQAQPVQQMQPDPEIEQAKQMIQGYFN